MKSGGQNTTLADCVLSTNDVIFFKKNSVYHKLKFPTKTYISDFFIF